MTPRPSSRAWLAAAAPAVPARFDVHEVERAVDRAYVDLEATLSFAERVWRFLGDIVGRLTDFAFESGWTRLAFGLLFLGLVVGLIILALRRAGLVSDARARLTDPLEKDVDWDEVARRAEASGDLDGALRAGFSALLLALANRGAVPDRRSLTAAEARDSVGVARPDLAPAVALATHAFERVAYARDDARSEDVVAMRRALDQVST